MQNSVVQQSSKCRPYWILVTAGVLFAVATLLGALEAHVLPSRLSPGALDIFATGVRYHFYNTLGLLAIGLTACIVESRLLRWSAVLVIIGIVLFSGSIYWLAFGAPTIIGFATPLGGLSLIIAWILYAVGVMRR